MIRLNTGYHPIFYHPIFFLTGEDPLPNLSLSFRFLSIYINLFTFQPTSAFFSHIHMEVVVPMAAPPPTVATEFNFDSNCSSPYITAPSSPQRFGNFFFSAPTSPTRISTFINNNIPSSSSLIHDHHQHEHEFQFDFSGHLQPPSLSADELFDGGKIRPFEPQSGLIASSSKPLSAHRKSESFDPATTAMEDEDQKPPTRGREKRAFSGRKGSRSLSPLRVSDIINNNNSNEERAVPSSSSSSSRNNTKASYASFLSSISFTRGYRKWRLKDFLLFRSASEGRATDKDPLRRKYEVLSKKAAAVDDDVRNSSFRSSDGSVSKRRGPVSAHEIHYTANRAASEEMKKRTLLPYKTGLLGCLGFNPTGMHEISRGMGSFTRS
ncbi:uncharacterized protein LOC107470059 [Arachis duranensis]|uniref:Uncharacterized protein LOC107470059 n=2 Tax=Arachis TaxID=3817 RepID=A0A6P4BN40_ARADU|nr:uncharacterized protein LOC107470059 [Arachis duranensis]